MVDALEALMTMVMVVEGKRLMIHHMRKDHRFLSCILNSDKTRCIRHPVMIVMIVIVVMVVWF